MGWRWLVGLIKLYVSFAEEPYKRDDILQKRLIIWSILLTVATPYDLPIICYDHLIIQSIYTQMNIVWLSDYADIYTQKLIYITRCSLYTQMIIDLSVYIRYISKVYILQYSLYTQMEYIDNRLSIHTNISMIIDLFVYILYVSKVYILQYSLYTQMEYIDNRLSI